MINKVRSIDFLPEVFRTSTNRQFLKATLDVLTSQPDLRRVQGFIGQKWGYGINSADNYVVEPTKTRSEYQLDPSVVFLKPDTQTARDFISYPGILQAIRNDGGITDNQNRLFTNQFYSWDSFTDLDKLVNYSEYYWIPNGPDAVPITTNTVYDSAEYTVTGSENGVTFAEVAGINSAITLLRGGTYTFRIDNNTQFWIQGVPGVTGIIPGTNINSREVLGVTNNGSTAGTVTFTVPQKDAQSQYTSLTGNNPVDLVTTLPYASVNGATTTQLPSIDGITQLNGKTLIFYDNGEPSSQVNIYNITVTGGVITLTPGLAIPNNEKITVLSGETWVGRNFYRDPSGVIILVPYISAILDTLYYQDGQDPNSFGIINLIENNSTNVINVDEIIGRKQYTSPNGITFTNGLKVEFQGSVTPSRYLTGEYYVEGVGSSINLLPVNDFIAVEVSSEAIYNPWDSSPWDINSWDIQLYVPLTPEYITISRNSRDLNAWSRSNRWFHQSVIDTTEAVLGRVVSESNTSRNTVTRAIRPIIEFRGNLQLFNSGRRGLGGVTLLDTATTDVFSELEGQPQYVPDPLNPSVTILNPRLFVDGQPINQGSTIVFTADTDADVRNNIWTSSYINTGLGPVLSLTPINSSGIGGDGAMIYVLSGNSWAGTSWWLRGGDNSLYNPGIPLTWTRAQQKSDINQSPLYDIFNTAGRSLGDNSSYPGTTFEGNKLFSFTPGVGASDPVLGFPLAYTSAQTLGDILFTVNLNSDTFTYTVSTGVETSSPVNIGYVYSYELDRTPDQPTLCTGWVTAAGPSYQYQVFDFPPITSADDTWVCDVPALPRSGDPLSTTSTVWNPVVVYVNGEILQSTQYSVAVTNNSDGTGTTTITTTDKLPVDTQVSILVISNVVSETGYWTVPQNLQNNPFNANISSVAVGDLRNQYQSVYSNLPGVTGQLYGLNNIHDLGVTTQWGTAIIQTSASMVLPGVFYREPGMNLVNAIQYNSEQYQNYKNLIVDLAQSGDFNNRQQPSQILDAIIYTIGTTRNSGNSFFWSDMLPSGSPYLINTYTFGAAITNALFPISPEVWSDTLTTEANYNGVLVYRTVEIDGIPRQRQLIRGLDYTISTSTPSLTITTTINAGDIITVKEYTQTYGSYCPNTPSKMGMYPATQPAVVLNNTYLEPTYFIVGHDGSYNKLWGNYNPLTGLLDDPRDIALLEFESRVYNNIKVSQAPAIPADSIIGGQWRTTDYSRDEILDIYSPRFLSWVGANRIDYRTQYYLANNQYTYNYNQSGAKIDTTGPATNLLQGYWRGIYRWYYDTDNPANCPWEMLGLTNKPDWWETRYGSAPYTSDNTYMWEEISRGYIWNGSDAAAYVNPAKVRPQLLEVLPVDGGGNLIPPFQSVVGLYNRNTFQRDWVVGDVAPVESSYLKSSQWPYDLMAIMSLTRPAQFYNLYVDIDKYRYESDFNQYLVDGRYHLDPRTIRVYGNGTSVNSYINWIVDYINVRGADGHSEVSTVLHNLDVRLTYNLAGFSDKTYLRFLTEAATPNSRNTNLLIPDESYTVLLYDNPPAERLVYSSVIIQKVDNGWRVWGNSGNEQYFKVSVPINNGNYANITVGDISVRVPNDYYQDRITLVPYGTIFYSRSGVAQFLNSYGNYLELLGAKFDVIQGGVVYNWQRMIQEYLNWTEQTWMTGSIISLNPSAVDFTVEGRNLVVQPLELQNGNYLLNQNLLPLTNDSVAVTRDSTVFNAKVLTPGDTIAYTRLNLNSIEHAVVFDNTTVFGDLIFNLSTGQRQPRLLLQGYKSGNWNGTMTADGFIINEDNVREWQPNLKYPKGVIVIFKERYYTSLKLIEPKSEFFSEDWLETDYNQIKAGLLPNPSTAAVESSYYYDTNRANLESDTDLLSYSLIGFRPREYLAAADLSDITQVGVYKNIIREKGTNLIANAFKGAQFDQGRIDYKVEENWAIKWGEFGGVLGSNFVEAALNQNRLTDNPSILQFTDSNTPVATGVSQSVSIDNLINWGRPPQVAQFLPPYLDEDVSTSSSVRSLIPTAGYVNLADATVRAYTYNSLNYNSDNLSELRRGNPVWIANHRGSWNIYSPQPIGSLLTRATQDVPGELLLQFDSPHGLTKNDLIAITSYNSAIDGFYTVSSTPTAYAITIPGSISAVPPRITGTGVVFKMYSVRYDEASKVADDNEMISTPGLGWQSWSIRKIWSDTSPTALTDLVAYSNPNGSTPDGDWRVWTSSQLYNNAGCNALIRPSSWGSSIAILGDGRTVALDRDGVIYIDGVQAQGAGTHSGISNWSNYQPVVKVASLGTTEVIWVSRPGDGGTGGAAGRLTAYSVGETATVMTVAQIIGVSNTGQIAVSSDSSWIWVSDTDNDAAPRVRLWGSTNPSATTPVWSLSNTINGTANTGWGSAISTDNTGRVLLVGAPRTDVSGITDAGSASVYSRSVQRWWITTPTTNFALGSATTVAQVFVDEVAIPTTDWTLVGGTSVVLSTPAQPGSIVEISTGAVISLSRLYATELVSGAQFGTSVAVGRNGIDLLVGAPYQVIRKQSSALGTNITEGAVYRWTDVGGRWGTVTLTPSVPANGVLYVDGYAVYFTGQSTSSTVAAALTGALPPWILVTSDSTSVSISYKPGSAVTPYDIMTVVADGVLLNALGIAPLANTQTLVSGSAGAYGTSLALGPDDTLLVGAPLAASWSPTVWDQTVICDTNTGVDTVVATVFDNDGTYFTDSIDTRGTVAMYSLMPATNSTISNPDMWVFSQWVTAPVWSNYTTSQSADLQPLWGTTLALNRGTIAIGAPAWNGTNGLVATFTPVTGGTCDPSRTTGWGVYRQPLPAVTVDALSDCQIYSTLNNDTLDYLDRFDPQQGVHLGAVNTNIDYYSVSDPARYEIDGGPTWGISQVGKTWLDTSTARLLDYHQPSRSYNAAVWGACFPGSTADIYTWVESTSLPINWTGPGYITEVDRWTSATVYDRNTDTLSTRYYFWVKNSTAIPPGKTLSPTTLSSYILQPRNSGISYLAPLTTDTVAITNSASAIAQGSVALHIGYRTNKNIIDDTHTNWILIRQGNPEDFLPGLPVRPGEQPTKLYSKYIDSFAGYDLAGNPVPDPRLPTLLKSGVSVRPQQSMFRSNLDAVRVYLTYANNVLSELPIVESRNLQWLFTQGPDYNTSQFWRYVDWWADGYSSDTKPDIEVQYYNDLLQLQADTTITGTSGTILFLENGLVARVLQPGGNRSETYIYRVMQGQTSGEWIRIGVTNGTIQFTSNLWLGPWGWASRAWDTDSWSSTPDRAIYWIVRWLNEVCYTADLQVERNNSLMLMFNYITSETLESRNYLPWLSKTSLIDVEHRVRGLLPYKRFQRDNSEFLNGYLNEVKPYHVYIKDFVYTYDGLDAYPGALTDFDLPAQWVGNTNTASTPQLVYEPSFEPDQYLPSDPIWQTEPYKEWFTHYGLHISEPETYIGVSKLLDSLYPSQTQLRLTSSAGLPVTGEITIGTERIAYDSIDVATGIMSGLTRGVGDTPISLHPAGEDVDILLPGVVVVDSGRGYTETPRVLAISDTVNYPPPRRPAQLQAVMAGDRVLGVTVIDPGEGYPVKPRIVIDGTFNAQFTSGNVNSDGYITINNHPFVTGDSVVYTRDSADALAEPLKEGDYCYVRVVDSNHILLYWNLADALNTETVQLDISGRVLFGNVEGTNKISVAARALCTTSAGPMRDFTITMKLDRVAYSSNVTAWQPGRFYAGPFNSPDTTSSSNLLSSLGAPDYLASNSGIVLQVTDFRVFGTALLTVTYPDYISPGQLTAICAAGYPVTFYDQNWSNPRQYYVRAVDSTRLVVFQDPRFTRPVRTLPFTVPFILYAPQPPYIEPSMVTYLGRLWRCVASNNSNTFNPSEWEEVLPGSNTLTAADRITAFYNPTPVQPGRDLRQLMLGVDEPYPIFKGRPFIETGEPLDTILQSPTGISEEGFYQVSGGNFSDGWGPEELVPGVVTDNLQWTTTTSPGSSWQPATLWDSGGWDSDDGWSGILDHTGFEMRRVTLRPDASGVIDWSGYCENPVSIDVYANRQVSLDGRDQLRLNTTQYTIDWMARTITIIDPSLTTGPFALSPSPRNPVDVVFYEWGGGRQLARGNSWSTPLRTVGDHSEIWLDIEWNTTIASAYTGLSLNGQPLTLGVDYYIGPSIDSKGTRIEFVDLYDALTTYVTWVIIGTPLSGTTVRGWGTPQTQDFTIGDIVNSGYTVTLQNFAGDDNPGNAIVDLNGYRLGETALASDISTSTPGVFSYSAPVSDPSTFIPGDARVSYWSDISKSWVVIPSTEYGFNWSGTQITGLDAEFVGGSITGGVLDSGVPLDNTTDIFVTFSPDPAISPTFSSLPFGTSIKVEYFDGTVYDNLYEIDPVTNTISFNNRFIDTSPTSGIISVTTFNRTIDLSLQTQSWSNVTVAPVSIVTYSQAVDFGARWDEDGTIGWDQDTPVIVPWDDFAFTPNLTPVKITTTIPHNIISGTQIALYGGGGQIDDLYAWASVVDSLNVELYLDQALSQPLVLYSYQPYVGGAYITNAENFVLNQTLYELNDVTRLWVSIDRLNVGENGVYQAPSILRLTHNRPALYTTPGEVNVLQILCEIQPGDNLIVTSTTPAGTPAPTTNTVVVDKNGDTAVWRRNDNTVTYVTQTMISTDTPLDTLHVADVSRLIVLQTKEGSTDSQGEFIFDNIIDSTTITYLKMTNTATGDVILNYTWDVIGRGVIRLRAPDIPNTGITVVIGCGNKITVNGEVLRFSHCDPATNTVQGLQRGLNGTVTNPSIPIYSKVYSMLKRDLLSGSGYNTSWYYPQSVPLQLVDNNTSATFLNTQTVR